MKRKSVVPTKNGVFQKTSRFSALLIAAALIGGLFLPISPACAMNDIILGQSCDLEGPIKALGIAYKAGASIYFDYINSIGGVRGRKIRLITYNDNYDKELCLRNVKKLINEDNVLLLFALLGTPTTLAAAPYAAEKNVPIFAPYTGVETIREPLKKNVFNIRAGYNQEIEGMVERLIADKNIKRISAFYMDNAFGKSCLKVLEQSLRKRGLKLVGRAPYNHIVKDVDPAVKILLPKKSEAVIMLGTGKPCADFIEKMRKGGSEALFLNLSVVGANALGQNLMNLGLGVVIVQVTPYPYFKKIPVVARYNTLGRQLAPDIDPNFVGMEGFLAAKALCKILEETPDPITREAFMKAAEKQGRADLGGFHFSYSPTSHRGSELVYFTQIGPGGYIAPIESLKDLYPFQSSNLLAQ